MFFKLTMNAQCNSYLSVQKLVWSSEDISNHIPNKLEEFQNASPLLPDWDFFYNRELATNMSPVKFKNSATSPITTPISSLSSQRYSKSRILHLFKPNVSLQHHQRYQIYSHRCSTGNVESCKLYWSFKCCKHAANKFGKANISFSNFSSLS